MGVNKVYKGVMGKLTSLKPRVNKVDTRRCAALQRTAWDGNNANKRLYKGRTLQRERERLFNSNPLCVECERQGRVTVATIRDHIIPLAEGGKDVPENIQGLCAACHNKKTIKESKRGKQNARDNMQ